MERYNKIILVYIQIFFFKDNIYMNQSILWVFDRIGNFKGSKSVRYILAEKLNIHIIPWNTREKINYSMYTKVVFDLHSILNNNIERRSKIV